MNTRAIGIFDSGLGGLTILKTLSQVLPKEKYIYFGDTANTPYGSKSQATVTRFSLDIARKPSNHKGLSHFCVIITRASILRTIPVAFIL